LQGLQVQGLQPQPALHVHGLQRQLLPHWQAFFCSLVTFFLLLLEASESPYNRRTIVRSQAVFSGLTIARLAAAAGVGVETVRYYQRRGLMTEPPRAGSIRRYGAEDVRRLQFIRHAQAAGFTLEEIKELLELDATDDRARARSLAQARVKALDDHIRKLKSARDALKKLATECAGGHRGPCPILSAFDA
jgi:MerR family mercuric resistance operon transcriptional regulator